VAKQKNIYVEQTAAIVASTMILSFITLVVVILQLSYYYPNVVKMKEAFHSIHPSPSPK